MGQKLQQTRWRRLDNTAKLFPVIANEKLSNVFRVSVTLLKPVEPSLLQRAVEEVLPWFEGFGIKLRRGFFWYYFETNRKTPIVEKEASYPCRYIDPHANQQFLFRVSYYESRINLEVFHAVTDGYGAVNFLKEITYRYLDLLRQEEGGGYRCPSVNLSLDMEDSYIRYYKKLPVKHYSTTKATMLKGETLYLGATSVIHGYISLPALKVVCKGMGVSITKYLTATLIWSIYQEYLNGQKASRPICINMPVDLRRFFSSATNLNFFAITNIQFQPTREGHTFEEILEEVSRQMDEKITREKMEETISYNVSNEKKWYVRGLPLLIKKLSMKMIYRRSSRATTTTLSNLGPITVREEYKKDIKSFHFLIGVAKRTNTKCAVCSYGDSLVVSFTSVLLKPSVQRAFFRALTARGIPVSIETNGVLNEEARP